MHFKHKLLWLFVLLAVIGCKKDKDNTPPSITVNTPVTNASFDVYDIVEVTATITDDQNLDYVAIELVDQNLIPVVAPKTFRPSGTTYNLVNGLTLDDIHTATGSYFLQVTANDGTNETKKFIEVVVVGVPLEVKEVLVVSAPTSNSVAWYRLDGNNNLEALMTVTSDYGGTAVSSYDQQLYTMGSFTGDLNVHKLSSGFTSFLWSIPTTGTVDFPHFNRIHQNEGEVMTYVSATSGEIKGYDRHGGVDVLANALSGYHPEETWGHNGLVVSDQKAIANSNRLLVTQYKISGAIEQTAVLNFDVVGYGTKSNDELFVLGNNNGQGELHIYNFTGNSFWSPHSIPAGAIRAVVQVDSNTLLIAHETGVYRYTYSNNSLITLINGVDATNMELNVINNELLLTIGTELAFHEYSTGAHIVSVYHSDLIRDVHVLYNK